MVLMALWKYINFRSLKNGPRNIEETAAVLNLALWAEWSLISILRSLE
jgi:hypothetical protein